jgi:hypothetical protein
MGLTSLNDVLLRDFAYLREPSIRDFVDTYLGPALRDKAARGSLPWAASKDAQRSLDHPVAIEYSLKHVHETLQTAPGAGEESAVPRLGALSAPLNQLLVLCHAWVEQLDQHFPGLRPVVEEQNFLEPLQAGNYVEVSRDGQQALAYEQPYMDRLEGRDGAERVAWGGAYRFEAQPDEVWASIGGVAP